MSRLDWITAIIVGICVIALGFLIYKTVGLMDTDDANPDRTEQVITDTPTEESTTTEASTQTDTIQDSGDDIDYADGDNNEDISTTEEEDEQAGKEEEDDGPSSYVKEENISGDYLVIAGTYKQMINAENQVKRLRKRGYSDARIALFNKGAYAVVLVNAFDSFSKADELSTQLNDDGFEAIVQKKRG